MYSFIIKRQPLSFNGWRKASTEKKRGYRKIIEDSIKYANPEYKITDDDLYGVLYYFFKKDLQSDVDNLSKPLWDNLKGLIFSDDNQIKLRIAGSYNLSKNGYSVLDFTGLTGGMVTELLDAFDSENHIMYVECGKFTQNLLKFNIESDGN
jgi:hypothetical protein